MVGFVAAVLCEVQFRAANSHALRDIATKQLTMQKSLENLHNKTWELVNEWQAEHFPVRPLVVLKSTRPLVVLKSTMLEPCMPYTA